jgi:hypothetical protein
MCVDHASMAWANPGVGTSVIKRMRAEGEGGAINGGSNSCALMAGGRGSGRQARKKGHSIVSNHHWRAEGKAYAGGGEPKIFIKPRHTVSPTKVSLKSVAPPAGNLGACPGLGIVGPPMDAGTMGRGFECRQSIHMLFGVGCKWMDVGHVSPFTLWGYWICS